MSRKPLLLSFDLEDFGMVRARAVGARLRSTADDTERGTEKFLGILEPLTPTTKLTFFTTAEFAEQRSQFVRRLSDLGHEIASHGYQHERVDLLSDSEFREVLRKSKSILEDCTGKPITGFRAPSFRVPLNREAYFLSLVESGYRYDSSCIFEAGEVARKGSLTFRTSAGDLREFPLLRLSPIPGVNIRSVGGTYLRFLPLGSILSILRRVEASGLTPMLWLHASDVDPAFQPLLFSQVWEASTLEALQWPLGRLSFKTGARSIPKKLEAVLREYAPLGPLGELENRVRVAL